MKFIFKRIHAQRKDVSFKKIRNTKLPNQKKSLNVFGNSCSIYLQSNKMYIKCMFLLLEACWMILRHSEKKN